MDESVESLESMNKRFISKISVVASTEPPKENLVKYLTNLQSEELVEDDYGNLRYIGANPNNYIQFNNELWRIIGVMKDIENPDGTKKDKVKLIRSENIGSYAWDNTANSGNNDWSTSTLQKVLNEGAYYNRTSGDCPSGSNGATKACDFSSTGLTSNAKSMISSSVWNLGGDRTSSKASEYYTSERGEDVSNGHTTKWTGKVGLIYPSDYGYATSGGSTNDRENCLNISLMDGNYWYLGICNNNDWIYSSSGWQWTITPKANNSYSVNAIGNAGYVSSSNAYSLHEIYPVVYLNPEISIKIDNDGSSTSPFVLK